MTHETDNEALDPWDFDCTDECPEDCEADHKGEG